MATTFISYLQAEGFISQEEAASYQLFVDEDDELSVEEEGQKLVDAGLMTSKEIEDALFFYKMNTFLEENTVTLSPEHIDDDFFNEYLNIIAKGFNDFLDVKVTCGEVEIFSSLQEEYIIYQPLIGQSDNTFITGVAGAYDNLMDIAATLHKKLAAGLDILEFDGTKEDMLDFFFELLNNINSTCSYKFNVDFDLDLPMYQENAELSAPRIYTVKITFLEFELIVLLICGGSCSFEREGL